MADISNELSNIARAIYGEEVRGSIYDAIARINAETEQAMSDMSDYRSVVDNIILSFNQWYTNVSEMFDGDIETNLANKIVGLKEDFDNLVESHEVIRSLVGEDDSYLEDGSGAIVSGRVVFCVAGDSENLTADMVYYEGTNTLRSKIESIETDLDAATYGTMKGATTSADGKAGVVPPPAAGIVNRFLRSDGAWAVPPDNDTTYGNMSGASTSAAGTAGLVPAPSAGLTNRVLRSDGAWDILYAEDVYVNYSETVGAALRTLKSRVPDPALEPNPDPGYKYLRDDGWHYPPPAPTLADYLTERTWTGTISLSTGSSGHIALSSIGNGVPFAVTVEVPNTVALSFLVQATLVKYSDEGWCVAYQSGSSGGSAVLIQGIKLTVYYYVP